MDDAESPQALILQKFWNLHGFSFVERFSSNKPMIMEMLQKEGALINTKASSVERIINGLPESPPAEENEEWHVMMLETFDTKTRECIVKNSWGPSGGLRGATNGKIRIPEAIFREMDYVVNFIGKTHSTHTSLEENGWMWAVATVFQTKQGNRCSLQKLVEEVKDQWYTLLAFLEWRKWRNISPDHWSAEQEQDWRRTEWWDLDSYAWYVRKNELKLTDQFYDSNGLQLSKGLGPDEWTTIKERLESEGPNALILLEPSFWKRMVSKFTKFHEINGDESDPGEPPLMILHGFVRNEQGEEGIYMLQDTHGLNGIHPAENEQKIIRIPEQELHDMHFTVWFVENRPQPITKDYQNQGISSPHTFATNGKHSSDLQDVYRVDFIDLETKQEKWFAINVMEEIEKNGQNESNGYRKYGRGFDVYLGKEMYWFNRKSIEQPHGLELEWDTANIEVVKISKLDSKGNVVSSTHESQGSHGEDVGAARKHHEGLTDLEELLYGI